jgi:hypothetical protein
MKAKRILILGWKSYFGKVFFSSAPLISGTVRERQKKLLMFSQHFFCHIYLEVASVKISARAKNVIPKNFKLVGGGGGVKIFRNVLLCTLPCNTHILLALEFIKRIKVEGETFITLS